MKLIDIHAHLDFPELRKQKELIEEIKKKNILVYSNTLSPRNYWETKELFKDKTHIKVTPGFYPVDIENANEEEIKSFFETLDKEKYDFIGEVGLDGKEGKNLEKQEEFLTELLKYCEKNNKSILLHTRKAEKETLGILSRFKVKVCLHCFTGKKKFYKDIKEKGYYCSIPLSVLRSKQLQELVKYLPLSRILVETDSPFLNPLGGINTPLNVPLIYEKIAEIKKLDIREVINIIYMNYIKFIA